MNNNWSRTTRYLVFFLTIGLLIWVLWAIRPLIGPLVIACLLAYVLNPAVTYVNSISKLPRKWVVTLVYTLIIGLLSVAIFTLTPVAIEQGQFLTVELREILSALEQTAAAEVQRLGLGINTAEIFGGIEDLLFAEDFSVEQIFSVVSATSRNLVWVLIILVTTFYLLQDWHRLREWLITLAPPDYQADVRRLYGEIKDTWQAYLWGQLILMTLIGVLSGVGSAAVGLRGSAVVLALIAGILDIIPSVGPAVAMVIATLVAWFQGPPAYLPMTNTWYMLLVLGIFVAIQSVENIWFRPRIMGQSLKMHPGVVFVAVMGSIAIGGILVALLIVPLIGSISIIGAYVRARIFGLEPWDINDEQPPPPMPATAEGTVDIQSQKRPKPANKEQQPDGQQAPAAK